VTLVSVVVVAYGEQPLLERCVESCRASLGIDLEVIVVDNGCTDGAVERIRVRQMAHVIDAGSNTGFTGGCSIGHAESQGEVIVFLNPDAIVDPYALAELCRVLSDPGVGIATASVRLLAAPELLNAAGNEVHFLGMSWCRGFEKPADLFDVEGDVIAASGAAMAVRRDVLNTFGGFAPDFFAYYEDVELSLRVWQGGLRVVYVPSSIVYHDYFFAANRSKLWLLDRNRILTMLTVFQWRTIIALAPLLVAQEVGLFVVAGAQGWFRDRVRSVVSVVLNQRLIRERRRVVQSKRLRSDGSYMSMFAHTVDPGNYPLPKWLMWIQPPLRGYWWLIKTLSR
jgi:GT2 family glycosyltransferase